MAEVDEIRAQILRERQKLEELKDSLEREHEWLTADYERSKRELERNYKAAVRKTGNDANQQAMQYASESIKDLEIRLSTAQSRYLKDVEKLVAEKTKEQEALLNDLNREYNELKNAFSSIVEKEAAKHNGLIEYVNNLRRNTVLEEQKVSNGPHEYFCPDQLRIIKSSMDAVDTAVANEMYESAASELNSMITDYRLLGTKVDQALDEWTQCFVIYCNVINGLYKRLNEFCRQPIQTCIRDEVLSEEQLNYWSSNTFAPIAGEIREMHEENLKIARDGLINYLKKQDPGKKHEIFDNVVKGRNLNDVFTGVTNCIVNEKRYSDERLHVGEYLAEALKNDSGYAVSNGFVNNDLLETYRLDIKLTDGSDVITILLIPIRKDGMTVRNNCIVSGDLQTIQSPEYAERLYNEQIGFVKNAITSINMSMTDDRNCFRIIMEFSSEQAGIQAAMNNIEWKKGKRDPQEQIRLMERRYQ